MQKGKPKKKNLHHAQNKSNYYNQCERFTLAHSRSVLLEKQHKQHQKRINAKELQKRDS